MDFKIVFISTNPEQIKDDAHCLLEDAIELFACKTKDCSTTSIAIVGTPTIYNEIEEPEPRIEYCLGIPDQHKQVGCIFILEHFMKCIKQMQMEKENFRSLKYFIVIQAPNGVRMNPFKSQLSAVDTVQVEKIAFANVANHNLLNVYRRVLPDEKKLRRIYADGRKIKGSGGSRNRRSKSRGQTGFNLSEVEKSIGRTNDSGVDMVAQSPPSGDEYFPTSKRTPSDDQPMREGSAKSRWSGPNFKTQAEFEHDRQLLNLTFYNNFNDTIDQIKLEVRYSSVSQVYLSLKRTGKKRFKMRLIFRVRYPPTIMRTNDCFGLKPRPGERHNGFKKALRTLCWHDNSAENGEEAVTDDVKDSPLVVVDLRALEAKEVSKLLNSLMVVLKLNLELRNFSEADRKRPDIQLDDEFFDDFELLYWVQALATRGYLALDHWVDEEEQKSFFALILQCNRAIAYEALELLADKLLDRAEVKNQSGLIGMLEDIIRDIEKNGSHREVRLSEGYERLKRVVITPSRTILCGHEVIMGNRILRFDRQKFPPEKFLRVIFRDEDGGRVHSASVSNYLIDRFVHQRLVSGIEVGGKVLNFIGTSNSQMRDGGCYFLEAELDEINEFRHNLGQFSLLPTIPKMMSRLGLCFTQGRETSVDMDNRMMGWDFTGGKDSNGSEYNFSDGCGQMSLHAAGQVCAQIGLDPDNPPMCFQFRYAGYKGILSVNPNLDKNKEFWDGLDEKERAEIGTKEECQAVDFYFRPSQKKFEVWPHYEGRCRLEIVKYSTPTPVFLNRPFINILDQVSELQSGRSHARICNRILNLLDQHVFGLCATLMEESAARKSLQQMPRLIEYSLLRAVSFTREPFFRLVLRAAAKVSIQKLRQKLAIAIPPEWGRIMFGVVDETGTLQYGQVFVQYSENVNSTGGSTEYWWSKQRRRKNYGTKHILGGRVLITKNPSIVGGDVRMFEAVDVPSLHHLVDVLVFPRYGPRPHSDEMAGSDLDGDEYVVIWDQELAFDGNQPAADYSPASDGAANVAENSGPVDECQKKMATFFVDYLKNDSVGRIAISHLANSDLYGIDHEVCNQLAKKHIKALDYPKTGNPPKKLTTDWNPETDYPPERYERAPDCMEKHGIDPQYVSTRLNAQIFRQAEAVGEFISATIRNESSHLPDVDQLLTSSAGEEEYLELAAEHYEKYAYRINRLMERYGIQCEGELFSSAYTSIRNRNSDREDMDMSFFNTALVIERQLWEIVRISRERFFGGEMEQMVDENGVCQDPSERLQKLARAYYTVTYGQIHRKLLSFCWAACWDVLDSVRRAGLMQNGGDSIRTLTDPFDSQLSARIEQFADANAPRICSFCGEWGGEDARDPVKVTLCSYTQRHRGLDKLMFFCAEWARKNGFFELSSLGQEHICLLLLSHGLALLPGVQRTWLTETSLDWRESSDAPSREISSPGRNFRLFLKCLASRQFKQLDSLDFAGLGLDTDSCLLRKGEWWDLHQFASKTYQHLAFSDSWTMLPDANGSHASNSLARPDAQVTSDVILIELPPRPQSTQLINANGVCLSNQLCAATGCESVILRPHPMGEQRPMPRAAVLAGRPRKPLRVLLSAWGTQAAIGSLRSLLAVTPQLGLAETKRERIQMLPEETLDKLETLLLGGRKQLPSVGATQMREVAVAMEIIYQDVISFLKANIWRYFSIEIEQLDQNVEDKVVVINQKKQTESEYELWTNHLHIRIRIGDFGRTCVDIRQNELNNAHVHFFVRLIAPQFRPIALELTEFDDSTFSAAIQFLDKMHDSIDWVQLNGDQFLLESICAVLNKCNKLAIYFWNSMEEDQIRHFCDIFIRWINANNGGQPKMCDIDAYYERELILRLLGAVNKDFAGATHKQPFTMRIGNTASFAEFTLSNARTREQLQLRRMNNRRYMLMRQPVTELDNYKHQQLAWEFKNVEEMAITVIRDDGLKSSNCEEPMKRVTSYVLMRQPTLELDNCNHKQMEWEFDNMDKMTTISLLLVSK